MSKHKTHKQKYRSQPRPGFREEKSGNKFLIWIPFVFAFILYGNTIPLDFALDDLPQIVNHKYVQQGWAGIDDLVTTNYWSGANQNLGYYRPLGHVTFAIENALHGNNPHIMHLVNVLLYALTGMVLFAFLSVLFRRMPFFVLAVTVLFLAHPVHTEVVANIKSRDEMLSFFNSIMALWLAYSYSKNKSKAALGLSWIFYFLALMSKETAMTTLAVVPFMLYFFTPKKGGFIAGVTLSFVLVSIGFLILKFNMIGTLSGDPPNETNIYPYKDFAGRIPTTLYIFGMYLYRLIFPVRLLYDYSYNQIPEADWANPVVLLSLVILITLVYLALKNLKRRNVLSFAIIYFGITVSVGLAFVLLRGGIMAERFLYAPVLGFSIAVNYYLFKLLPRERKTKRIIYDFRPGASRMFLGILSVLILFYSIRTIARNPVWKDNYTLFSTDIRYGGESALLRKHYGSELINMAVEEKDKDRSDSLMSLGIAEVQKSLEINPRFSEAYFKLGYAYYQLRDYDKSIQYYKQSNQNNSQNVSNLALAYYMKGEYGQALRLLKRSLQLDPGNSTARRNMPLVQSAFDRKMRSLKENASADPEEYYELGNLYVDQKNYAEALKAYKQAVDLDPEFVGAMINMGNCYYFLQDYQNALKTFKAVLDKDPDNRMAMRNLSHLYGLLGNNEMQIYYEQKLKGIEQ